MSDAETASHTKGPWAYDPDAEWIVDYSGTRVCHMGQFGEIKPFRTCHNHEANARLIASAPTLLEALEVVHDCGTPIPCENYGAGSVNGYVWAHSDGREWVEASRSGYAIPEHPIIAIAIAKAKGDSVNATDQSTKGTVMNETKLRDELKSVVKEAEAEADVANVGGDLFREGFWKGRLSLARELLIRTEIDTEAEPVSRPEHRDIGLRVDRHGNVKLVEDLRKGDQD